MVRRSNWGLIGLADDLGVYNVGGRVGAAGGPSALRVHLTKMQGRSSPLASMKDAGDWMPPASKSFEPDLAGAGETVAALQKKVDFSVVVGGGNDLAYAQLLGVARATGARRMGCINIDAHFDLRKPNPYPSSGSPFYLALENHVLDPSRFVEFGIQSHCNSPALWDYAQRNKIKTVEWSELRGKNSAAKFRAVLGALAKKCDVIVVCFDLDAIAQAYAPGVSAPQAEGFTASEAVALVEIAAKQPKVKSLGLFELNPEHDENRKTARLAATLVWNYARERLSTRTD